MLHLSCTTQPPGTKGTAGHGKERDPPITADPKVRLLNKLVLAPNDQTRGVLVKLILQGKKLTSSAPQQA